ncbi:MAG: hypothetical protein IJ748_07390 [Bacteroidales bacterium]|nr:hypothetical protein [Bacteroidales bacterium]
MPFVKEILNYKSVSFVGMDKNAGKTEALNYVISRLSSFNKSVAVTSIGIDGETLDQVTSTSKPMVFLYPDTIFVTSEKLYDRRQAVSQVEALSKYSSGLGRLVSARTLSFGNVMLSGPTSTLWLKELIDELSQKADICLIDGALSRKSFASPSITEAMILSTGAVISASIDKITDKTKFMYDMTKLPCTEEKIKNNLINIQQGIFAIDKESGEIKDLEIPSLLMIDKYRDKLFSASKTLFIPGMITDKLLETLKSKKNTEEYTLITKDFTHVFSSPLNTRRFLQLGGKIEVLYNTKLLAVTVNPVSPAGFKVDNLSLLSSLRSQIDLPIYNIRSID